MVAFAQQSNSHGELDAETAGRFAVDIRQSGLHDAIERIDASQRKRIRRLILAEGRSNVLALTNPEHRGRILDFGCGYGGISRRLARSFKEVYSLDGSLERLSILDAILHEDAITNVVPVFQQDVLNLPFADASFDAVLLVGVFEYLPAGITDCDIASAHERCFGEFRRVLRPGGRLIIGTHNRFGWPYLMGAVDHGGYPFRQVLPRSVETMVASALRRSPCRMGYYSPEALAQLARRSFRSTTLYWPWPDYQVPQIFTGLGDRPEMAAVVEAKYTGSKRVALRLLASAGLLPRLIPSFYIVCDAD